jgi:hypothetical protein
MLSKLCGLFSTPSSSRPQRVYSQEKGLIELHQEEDLFSRAHPEAGGLSRAWKREEGDSQVSVRLTPFGMSKFTVTPQEGGQHVRHSQVDVEDHRYTYVEEYFVAH